MVGNYRTEGVVLRTWKLGEADRIVSFVTAEHGKVRAVAKGVRKTSSRFGGRLEPTNHVALQLYLGRGELQTVTQVEVIDRYEALRGDLDRYAAAMTLLEAVDAVAQEGHADPELLRMLVGGLGALQRRAAPALVGAFLLRVLAHEGLVGLDDDGEVMADALPATGLSPATAELAAQILDGRLGQALNAESSPATHELTVVAARLFEAATERRLRSASLFDRS